MLSEYYSFVKDEDDENNIFYHFVTSHNVVYTSYFKNDEYSTYVDNFPLLLHSGYAFGFKKLQDSSSKNVNDPAVFTTIYQIINDFFNTYGKEIILLYHCQSSDNKQSYRGKLFDTWENRIEDKNFIKHAVQVTIAEEDYYFGFISLVKNPLIEDIKAEFEKFLYFVIQPK